MLSKTVIWTRSSPRDVGPIKSESSSFQLNSSLFKEYNYDILFYSIIKRTNTKYTMPLLIIDIFLCCCAVSLLSLFRYAVSAETPDGTWSFL